MANTDPAGRRPGGHELAGPDRPTAETGADDREVEPVELSLVFTAWNEEDTLERAITAGLGAGQSLVSAGDVADFEVLVVDDGSTDRTAEIAEKAAAADVRVRVVHHEANRGLGAAMRTGYAASRGNLVLCTGSDLPFDLIEVGKAVRILRDHDADIVAAYRFDRTGEGPRRFVYSYVYNLLARCVFGLRVRDVNFAAKLVRREVLDTVELRSEGSFIDVELLARSAAHGHHTVQFGVDYFPRTRGVSTLSSFPVILTIVREMTASAREIRGSSRPRSAPA